MASSSPGSEDMPRWNIRHLFLLVPWIGLGLAAFRPIRDNSFLWHIQAGTLQATSGRVLTEDPFSLSFRGEPWRTQSWLVELAYSKLYEATGLGFVGPWIVALGGVLLVSVGIVVYQRSRSVLATALAVIGLSWMGVAYFAPRPVIVSWAALGLLVLVTRSHRALWAAPLLIWVWSATHGSFIIGIGFLVLMAARTRRLRYVSHALIGAVLSSLTAHGLGAWSVLIGFFDNRDALEVIQEWGKPDILSVVLWPFTVGLVVILYRSVSGSVAKADLWILAPFLLFGLTSKRALFVSAIVLAVWVAKPGRESTELRSGFGLPVLVTVAGLVFAVPFLLESLSGQLDEGTFPVAASEYLAEGPVFHDAAVGGYLILFEVEQAVLVDDRAELYGREFFDRVIEAERGQPTWRALFEDLGIEQALIRADDDLVEVLRREAWVEQYSDDVFAVMRRP